MRCTRRVIDLMDAWKVEMDAGRQKMNQDALNKVRWHMHEVQRAPLVVEG